MISIHIVSEYVLTMLQLHLNHVKNRRPAAAILSSPPACGSDPQFAHDACPARAARVVSWVPGARAGMYVLPIVIVNGTMENVSRNVHE
jgi:hypothetical protein